MGFLLAKENSLKNFTERKGREWSKSLKKGRYIILRHSEKTPRCGHHLHIVAFDIITTASYILPWSGIIRPRRRNLIFHDHDNFKHDTTTWRCFLTTWLRFNTLFEECFFGLFWFAHLHSQEERPEVLFPAIIQDVEALPHKFQNSILLLLSQGSVLIYPL